MSLKTDLWRAVIQAIEAAIPEYDMVNQRITLGRALRLRNYAAEQLRLGPGMTVLDAGIGPGTMCEVLLSKSASLSAVGLDASATLLHAARERLSLSFSDRVHLVRGTFEALPFRDKCFQRIVSAYAFRDSRNRSTAIDEFSRVSADGGTLAIVDLGKPDNFFKRILVTVYVRYLMPFIAQRSKSDSINGNPWRMIVPTYEELRNNHDLVRSLRNRFVDVKIREFGLGGLITIFARKSDTEPL